MVYAALRNTVFLSVCAFYRPCFLARSEFLEQFPFCWKDKKRSWKKEMRQFRSRAKKKNEFCSQRRKLIKINNSWNDFVIANAFLWVISDASFSFDFNRRQSMQKYSFSDKICSSLFYNAIKWLLKKSWILRSTFLSHPAKMKTEKKVSQWHFHKSLTSS